MVVTPHGNGHVLEAEVGNVLEEVGAGCTKLVGGPRLTNEDRRI